MTGNFSKTHLPELGAHLVAALARLDVNNLRTGAVAEMC